jgi:tetratricopeptide (TPR) repeat protein
MAGVKLFLSCVSDEFGAYREALRHALTRPNVEIKIQEDFKTLGGDTLAKLETYVESCDVVVHFIGDMAGSIPKPNSVDDLLKRRPELAARLAEKDMTREALGALTYTQWEAWLAVGFNKDGARRNLVIVTPVESAQRGPKFEPSETSRASQAEHLKRLRAINIYPAQRFTNADNLVAQVLASAVLDALKSAEAAPTAKPRNLPFASLGWLFAGRTGALEDLRAALLGAKGAAVVVNGLGGVGKTRLAIEYAWGREADYSALVFVRASDAAALNASLAALSGPEILDLPEKEAREDSAKIAAVLRWLETNPLWLMILDNVEDRDAVAGVSQLLPRLKGGHMIVTARATNFPVGFRKLELDVLKESAAAQFLLDRTDADRSKTKDDAALARTLARELGGLALGLEQAGAHIAVDRVGFARYLNLWSENREKAVAWADATVMGSERTLATTWATSVARLSPKCRRLLDRLAFLAPDPIPDSLLDVAVPGEALDYDAYEARAGLYAYSLIARVTTDDGGAPGFIVHRLVQDFARRAMSEERKIEVLRGALRWVNRAFVGHGMDACDWPTLDPIAPHALAVAHAADSAGIAEPTGSLFNNLGVLFRAKARFAEAESLYRRVLAIDEVNHGPDHPNVATGLNNLGLLLQQIGRNDEAERFLRRALEINETALSPHYPNVATGLNNLAELLLGMGRYVEAEPLVLRALAIDESLDGPRHPRLAKGLNILAGLRKASHRAAEAESLYRSALAIDEAGLGPKHPLVARDLHNLAQLLQATNRLVEAELLLRRALAIRETSIGLDHPDTVGTRENLAVLLSALGKCG